MLWPLLTTKGMKVWAWINQSSPMTTETGPALAIAPKMIKLPCIQDAIKQQGLNELCQSEESTKTASLKAQEHMELNQIDNWPSATPALKPAMNTSIG